LRATNPFLCVDLCAWQAHDALTPSTKPAT
jgi:hypothetical protein